jgi:phosphatidylglycerol---prolipoprotein diacylglyceryl transferase
VHKVLFVVPGVGLKLYSFSLMMLVACFAALWLTAWRARRERIDPGVVTDLAIWLMGGGFIGARVFYLLQYPETIVHPWDVFKIWQGGIVYYGCIVGGLIGSLIYWARHPFPFWAMADAVAPALALGEALGRVGCLLNGCCFGVPCAHPWAIHFPSESLAWYQHVADGRILSSAAYSVAVHPTQVYSIVGGLLILGLLTAYYPRRRRDGEVMALLMLSYPVARFLFEALRGDERVFLAGLTMSQGISVVVFLGGLALWWQLSRLPAGRHADGATRSPTQELEPASLALR